MGAPSLIGVFPESVWRPADESSICTLPTGTLLRRSLSTISGTSSVAPHMGVVLQNRDTFALDSLLLSPDFVQAIQEVTGLCAVFHYHDAKILKTRKTMTTVAEFAEGFPVEVLPLPPSLSTSEDVVFTASSHFDQSNYGLLETCQSAATAVALGGVASCHVTLLKGVHIFVPIVLSSGLLLLLLVVPANRRVFTAVGVCCFALFSHFFPPLVLSSTSGLLLSTALCGALFMFVCLGLHRFQQSWSSTKLISYCFRGGAIYMMWATSTSSQIVPRVANFVATIAFHFPSVNGWHPQIGTVFTYICFFIFYSWVLLSRDSSHEKPKISQSMVVSFLMTAGIFIVCSHWPKLLSFHVVDFLTVAALMVFHYIYKGEASSFLDKISLLLFMRMQPEAACLILLTQQPLFAVNILSILFMLLYSGGYRVHICQALGI